jgi:hypothetical protein
LRKRAGPSSVPETKLMYKCISESNTLPITLRITPNNSFSRNGSLILNLHHRGFYPRPVSRSVRQGLLLWIRGGIERLNGWEL